MSTITDTDRINFLDDSSRHIILTNIVYAKPGNWRVRISVEHKTGKSLIEFWSNVRDAIDNAIQKVRNG